MSKEKATERIGRSNTSSKKSSSGIFILLSLVVVCLLGVVVLLGTGKDSGNKVPNETVYNRVVTPDNIEQVLDQLDEADKSPIGSYEVKMNTEWTFPNGSSASTNAYVENAVTNQHTVYFTIALKSDSSKDIYKSPNIPVGCYMQDIKLAEPLAKGTYDAVLTYHMLDSKDVELGTLSITLILTIEN